jgi:hypothetical protein
MKITMHVLRCEETLTSWTIKWTKDWVKKWNSNSCYHCSDENCYCGSGCIVRMLASSRLASSLRRKSPTHNPAPSHLDTIFLASSSSAASHNKSKTINFVSSYAHVCSRMLTYAHVCSRMITYAHACSGMLSQTRRKPKPFPSRTNLNLSNLTCSIVWQIYQRGRAA